MQTRKKIPIFIYHVLFINSPCSISPAARMACLIQYSSFRRKHTQFILDSFRVAAPFELAVLKLSIKRNSSATVFTAQV